MARKAEQQGQFWAEYDDAETFGSAITRIYRPVFHDTQGRRARVSPVGSDATEHFAASIEARSFGDLVLSTVRAPGHLVDYHGLVTPSESALKIYYVSKGTAVIRQDGREQTLEAGQLGVHDSMRPYQVWTDTGFDSLILALPKGKLSRLGEGYADLSAVRFTSDSGPGRVVLPFLKGLAENMDELGSVQGHHLARNTVGLLTTLFASATGQQEETFERRREAQRGGIAMWMRERLDSADLTPRAIAAAHFMSVRSLHALFAEAGTSVGKVLRTIKLDNAQMLLEAHPTMPVSEVGRRSGFADPSYFSRTFRAEYGVTPKEFRVGVLHSESRSDAPQS